MMVALVFAALIAATAAPTLARAEPASSAVVENSLTVFPTTIDVEVRRDEVVDRTIGIVQTGAERREVSFEISGDAAPYVSIHGVASGSEIDRIEAEDGVPTFVVMRFAPVGPLPDGQLTAGVEIVAQGAEVAIGSMIGVELDVGGDHVVRARVLEVATAGSVEIGRPFRLTATLDVEGTVVLEPEISLVLTSATATEELRAHPPPVEPGTGRAVQASWFTGSWTPGRYDGEVVFGAQGVEIGRAPVSIEVVPAGTAPRAVEVLSAEVIETSRPGGIAKVAIQVRNVGAFEGRAVFVGDLWRGATVVAPLRSDPLVIAPDATAELIVYARTDEAGAHRVRGRANLDGADSSEFAIEFDVDGSAEPVWWFLTAIAGAMCAGGAIAWRRHRAQT